VDEWIEGLMDRWMGGSLWTKRLTGQASNIEYLNIH
jgi:hypothetical protein